MSGRGQRLLEGFVAIEDGLLIERYNQALAAIGLPATKQARFHVDAAGYSPEIAAELGDPLYLGPSALEARAILVSAAQLKAPLVHPGLGFAARAFRKAVASATKEITSLTLREPLLAEASHKSGGISEERQLADIARFELGFRTPGGHLVGTRRLEEMKTEFLASDRLWLDDEFIGEMATLAERVRGVTPSVERLASSDHTLDPFFTPAFGGTYVVEERGPRKTSTTIFCGRRTAAANHEVGDRHIALQPLEAAPVVAALLQLEIARLDFRSLRDRQDMLLEIKHWLAVEHLAQRHEKALERADGPRDVERLMRDEANPPHDYAELSDLIRGIRAGRSQASAGSLSPENQLRLLSATSTKAAVRDFVNHVQAGVDPAQLGRMWESAPDLFFLRWHDLSDGVRAYFSRWLGARTRA